MQLKQAMGEYHGRPRLLVADRHRLVAAGLAALLSTKGHRVTGCVDSGAAAAGAIAAGEVDVALLDIDLAAPSPIEILTAPHRARLVILADRVDHPGLEALLGAGVRGLVLKTEDAEGLDQCLVAVAEGREWFDRRALAHAANRRATLGSAARLTPRERDVARLVATGQRNRGIAGVLGISEGTVKMHLHNVYAKLGLESRTQLAMDERLRLLA